MTDMKPDPDVEALRPFSTALITDALKRLKAKDAWTTGISRFSLPGDRMIGRAVILNYERVGTGSGRNATGQFDVIASCGHGDVLIYAALGVDAWLIGDNVANYAKNFDLAGIVVDGGARDTDDIKAIDLPVFAGSASARPYSSAIWLEAINRPARFAGAKVKHRDIVVGDSDGIVVIPSEIADEVLLQVRDLDAIDKALSASIARRAPLAELNAIAARKAVLATA